jgi:hypothetical protein
MFAFTYLVTGQDSVNNERVLIFSEDRHAAEIKLQELKARKLLTKWVLRETQLLSPIPRS